MARRRVVTQADMTRALKSFIAAGLSVSRVEIEAQKVIIVVGDPTADGSGDDLDAELQEFEQEHGQD